jgi:Xaa-Pro aminopeptidase
LAGWGGVRIEDDIIITDNKCEILNKTTKELVVLN